jgi:2-dehydropantoate 2-reductase
MKILVIGVGGIGGFIGSFLHNAGLEITFIARNTRLNFLKKNGLILQSSIRNIECSKLNVFNSIKDGESFDIIINTVKLYDFDKTFCEIRKKIDGKFVLLPFQNGIYAEEEIKRNLGVENTYGAVAQISSYVNDKQIVKHVGKLATFYVGKYDNSNDNKVEKFCKICRKSGLDFHFKNNIKEKIWEKFVFLSAYSGMTTLTQKTIGEIFSNDFLKDKFITAMKETYTLAKKYNVEFKKNPIEFWLQKIEKMPYEMTSSMFVDYKKKKRLELQWLSGSLVKKSQEFGVNMKVHKEIVKGII